MSMNASQSMLRSPFAKDNAEGQLKSRSQIYTVHNRPADYCRARRAQPSIKETTMYTALRYLSLVLLIAFGAFAASASALAADSEEGILVGRIAHIEANFSYVDEGKDWVATVDDAPFGLEDALYSGGDTKASSLCRTGPGSSGEHPDPAQCPDPNRHHRGRCLRPCPSVEQERRRRH